MFETKLKLSEMVLAFHTVGTSVTINVLAMRGERRGEVIATGAISSQELDALVKSLTGLVRATAK